jgi:hypothetical protein
MRKKLLALLMCATMVLGTAATAFAAPSEQNWSDAAKVLSNSKNIIDELYKENATVKTTAYVTSIKKTATFGYDTKNDNKAVKLNDDGQALLYIDTDKYVDLSASVAQNVVIGSDTYVNPSAAIAKLASYDSASKTTVDAPQYAIVSYKLSSTETKYALAERTADFAGKTPVANQARYKIVTELATDSDGNYASADGWSYTVDTNAKLKKADTKDVSGSGITAVEYTTAAGIDDLDSTLAKAIEDGVLTSDAVAVVLTAYASVGSVNVDYTDENWMKLSEVKTPVSGFTVTSLTDLLSRTSLKDAINIFNINTEVYGFDSEIGKVYQLGEVASDIDISGSKFTFTLPFSGEQNVLIFDQAEAQSNNDGVASETTTTAASQTAASSPKTGDVAPIAALAVVMMGACGAMVVASKKRA